MKKNLNRKMQNQTKKNLKVSMKSKDNTMSKKEMIFRDIEGFDLA